MWSLFKTTHYNTSLDIWQSFCGSQIFNMEFYKGIIGKWPFHGHFTRIPFAKILLLKHGSLITWSMDPKQRVKKICTVLILTWDGRVTSMRLTGGTVLCPWARHFILFLVLVHPRRQENVPTLQKNCWLGCKASTRTNKHAPIYYIKSNMVFHALIFAMS